MKRALAVFMATFLVAGLLVFVPTASARCPMQCSAVYASEGDDDGWMKKGPEHPGTDGVIGGSSQGRTSPAHPTVTDPVKRHESLVCELRQFVKNEVTAIIRRLRVAFFWPAR
jgi:hypothetical protein